MDQQRILRQIGEKYKLQGVNHETYLRGLLQLKPLNYWDYVEVDTLLSLQRPRTDFKDEEVFILCHQVTELLMKLMIHEIKQIVEDVHTPEALVRKLNRVSRYTSVLISWFENMRVAIDYEDYSVFRCALAPASGFQSAQFRFVEIYCTRLSNLVNAEGKKRLPENPKIEDYFENIYWRDAGMDRANDQKTLTLHLFEEKYLTDFIALAHGVQGNTIEEKILRMEVVPGELHQKLMEFDFLYNYKLPMVHLGTANYFLNRRGEKSEATGGSAWCRYLHPASQQRKFFPSLWKDTDISTWDRKNKHAEQHV